jgi:serine phosphatase RsbU (regulator of sigma subunit)
MERAASSTLAQRLEAVLRGGAQALGCSAAGVYMLDRETTQLKLRASWGLRSSRLTSDTRPLDEALADLEALCGHAVTMESQDLVREWRCPERDFSAAVCVPISSSTTLLGTLWMLADEPRAFSDAQTNLAEIVAGRIASDLQCETLLNEAVETVDLRRQLVSAERSQQNALPQIAPLADAWEVAGGSWQAGPLGGAFHDWFTVDDNTLAIVVGSPTDQGATGQGIEAALAASELRATVRAHAASDHDAASLMQRVDEAITRSTVGDRRDQLCYAMLDADMGRVRYTTAGAMGILMVGRDGWQSLSQTTSALSSPSAVGCEQHMRVLQPGESLVIYNRALLGGSSTEAAISESVLAEWLLGEAEETAAGKIDRLRQQLEDLQGGPANVDRTLLIARYRG